ncbi:MAG TPA: hypothetical protein VHQ86_02840 [Candidatus Saccharimonadia bacterium]|jgi:hypothetical protein|nr:hypothetical protein [Candidatus Saccharimonadia bacterium]
MVDMIEAMARANPRLVQFDRTNPQGQDEEDYVALSDGQVAASIMRGGRGGGRTRPRITRADREAVTRAREVLARRELIGPGPVDNPPPGSNGPEGGGNAERFDPARLQDLSRQLERMAHGAVSDVAADRALYDEIDDLRTALYEAARDDPSLQQYQDLFPYQTLMDAAIRLSAIERGAGPAELTPEQERRSALLLQEVRELIADYRDAGTEAELGALTADFERLHRERADIFAESDRLAVEAGVADAALRDRFLACRDAILDLEEAHRLHTRRLQQAAPGPESGNDRLGGLTEAQRRLYLGFIAEMEALAGQSFASADEVARARARLFEISEQADREIFNVPLNAVTRQMQTDLSDTYAQAMGHIIAEGRRFNPFAAPQPSGPEAGGGAEHRLTPEIQAGLERLTERAENLRRRALAAGDVDELDRIAAEVAYLWPEAIAIVPFDTQTAIADGNADPVLADLWEAYEETRMAANRAIVARRPQVGQRAPQPPPPPPPSTAAWPPPPPSAPVSPAGPTWDYDLDWSFPVSAPPAHPRATREAMTPEEREEHERDRLRDRFFDLRDELNALGDQEFATAAEADAARRRVAALGDLADREVFNTPGFRAAQAAGEAWAQDAQEAQRAFHERRAAIYQDIQMAERRLNAGGPAHHGGHHGGHGAPHAPHGAPLPMLNLVPETPPVLRAGLSRPPKPVDDRRLPDEAKAALREAHERRAAKAAAEARPARELAPGGPYEYSVRADPRATEPTEFSRIVARAQEWAAEPGRDAKFGQALDHNRRWLDGDPPSGKRLTWDQLGPILHVIDDTDQAHDVMEELWARASEAPPPRLPANPQNPLIKPYEPDVVHNVRSKGVFTLSAEANPMPEPTYNAEVDGRFQALPPVVVALPNGEGYRMMGGTDNDRRMVAAVRPVGQEPTRFERLWSRAREGSARDFRPREGIEPLDFGARPDYAQKLTQPELDILLLYIEDSDDLTALGMEVYLRANDLAPGLARLEHGPDKNNKDAPPRTRLIGGTEEERAMIDQLEALRLEAPQPRWPRRRRTRPAMRQLAATPHPIEGVWEDGPNPHSGEIEDADFWDEGAAPLPPRPGEVIHPAARPAEVTLDDPIVVQIVGRVTQETQQGGKGGGKAPARPPDVAGVGSAYFQRLLDAAASPAELDRLGGLLEAHRTAVSPKPGSKAHSADKTTAADLEKMDEALEIRRTTLKEERERAAEQAAIPIRERDQYIRAIHDLTYRLDSILDAHDQHVDLGVLRQEYRNLAGGGGILRERIDAIYSSELDQLRRAQWRNPAERNWMVPLDDALRELGQANEEVRRILFG